MAAKMEKKTILSGFGICVIERGFVYVGTITDDGEWCVITDARNIRYWGTERGLGQLALEGPTEKTKLDAVGTVRVPHAGVIHILDSEAKLWNK